MPYGSVPTGKVLQNRGHYPQPGGRSGQGNPGGADGPPVPSAPPGKPQGPGGPYMGGPAGGQQMPGAPPPRPLGPPQTPTGGAGYLGPPVSVGGKPQPGVMGPPNFRMGPPNPGAQWGALPGGQHQPAIGGQGGPSPIPMPAPAGPPQGNPGGQASPMQMPDGRTVWIWNGRVYPYNPTGGGVLQQGPPLEDTNPQTPQGGQAY